MLLEIMGGVIGIGFTSGIGIVSGSVTIGVRTGGVGIISVELVTGVAI